MNVLQDIGYSETFQEYRRLDVYLPEAERNNRTCLLFIHGGGWHKGSRAQFAEVAAHFAELGYTCFSISYRFAPEWKFPSQLEDAQAAFAYVIDKAAVYGYDADRIVTLGSSAGGYLALMLALRAEGFVGPAAVAAYCPVVLLEERHSFVKDFIEGEREKESPLHRVKAGLPPILFLQGDADDTTPLSYASQMHEQLLKQGNHSRLKVLPGVGHGFGYGVKSESQKTAITEIEGFLHELGLNGSAA